MIPLWLGALLFVAIAYALGRMRKPTRGPGGRFVRTVWR